MLRYGTILQEVNIMRKHIKGNVSLIGYLDWDLQKFHGDDFTIHNGSSQNAYLIEEEKTILMDTVWAQHQFEYMENLKKEVNLAKVDAIVVQHGECDHSGTLPALMRERPDLPIYCTANAVKSLEGQWGKHGWDFHVVKTGDELDIGNGKKLVFVEMPMLHWPDSMATFLTGDNILFSMDAFGQHYAVGEMYADLADQDTLWNEAERYYANIVSPFAPMVTKKVKEITAMNLPIEMICPSHGAIWRKDPLKIVEAYGKWAADPTEDRITVIYGTMWHGTEKLAHAIADELSLKSPHTIVKVYNVDHTPKDDIAYEVFRSKAVAIGSPTILNGVLDSVAAFTYYLKSLKLMKGRKAAVFGCYGWSGEGNKVLRQMMTDAGFDVADTEIRCSWNPENDDLAQAAGIADALLEGTSAASDDAPAAGSDSGKWRCPCGYVYDPAKGDPDNGVPAGTPWEKVPDDWTCPVCHLPKSAFRKVD